jgi:hypothetical protein
MTKTPTTTSEKFETDLEKRQDRRLEEDERSNSRGRKTT